MAKNMQARDAKQGYPVYILNRKDISVKVGKITNTPTQHFDNNFPGTAKMVVDLNIEIDGKAQSYVLETSAEIGYIGDLCVTLDRDNVQREIESIKAQSEQALKMVQYHENAVAKCNELLAEYSPEFKQRTEYAERLQGVESKVDKLADALNAFLNQQKGGAR